MAHQSTVERAHPVSFEPKNYEAHHNKPEEHEPSKDEIDYNSLEEALLGDS